MGGGSNLICNFSYLLTLLWIPVVLFTQFLHSSIPVQAHVILTIVGGLCYNFLLTVGVFYLIRRRKIVSGWLSTYFTRIGTKVGVESSADTVTTPGISRFRSCFSIGKRKKMGSVLLGAFATLLLIMQEFTGSIDLDYKWMYLILFIIFTLCSYLIISIFNILLLPMMVKTQYEKRDTQRNYYSFLVISLFLLFMFLQGTFDIPVDILFIVVIGLVVISYVLYSFVHFVYVRANANRLSKDLFEQSVSVASKHMFLSPTILILVSLFYRYVFNMRVELLIVLGVCLFVLYGVHKYFVLIEMKMYN